MRVSESKEETVNYVYVFFVDLKAAFDNVDGKKVIDQLRNLGLLQNFRNIHRDFKCSQARRGGN